MRPLMLEGLAMAMTLVTKYTQGARFLCTEDSCPNSQGFQKIRVHVPGATEWATVRNDFTCSLCGSPLKEDVKSRVLGDKQLVEVIHAKALRVLSAHTLSSSRHQSLTVFLRGRLYRIIGIPAHVHQWPNVTFSVEANSVQPWVPECPSFISDNFQALLSATACSPWRFPAIVANAFGSQIVPPGLYNTLKLCLLLSLVQTAGEDRETLSYLDVLALTTDTLVIDRLMTYSLALASRGVRHRTSGELFPSVSRDEHGTGAASIHAGAALLATGGICFIGDLASCRKDKAELLQSALETRAVTVFIPGKKYGEDADQQLSLPLQCNIWALADTGASTKKFLKYENAALGSMDTGFLPSQMSDAFGLVIHCRELPIERPALPLAVHILRQAVKPEEPLYPASEQFTTDDYKGVSLSSKLRTHSQNPHCYGDFFVASKQIRKISGVKFTFQAFTSCSRPCCVLCLTEDDAVLMPQLIAAARGVQAELSPEAERLIHGYFLASRRVRTGTAQGPKVPVASVKLLFSFAEAHAKLSLRSRVLEEDAVIAVLLCENSITLKHGASALVLPPEAVFSCGLHDQASLERRDLALRQLHQQILQFVLTYAPGASSYISEE
nr:PREDICTED: MCM domain-containing protein 2 isoform X1 [Lepisosteus oculatus]